MSLNGKLEDVSLTDVMQFIHLGRRTGTLTVHRSQEEAEIGFHRGQIVSASGPHTARLGELLVEKNLLSAAQLETLIERQRGEHPHRSLGQLLVSDGILSFDQIRSAIERQIEQTVFELVAWTTGSFEFALDELKPIDDIAMYPGDVIPKLDLNTQVVLLEATRLFDERHRRDTGEEAPADADDAKDEADTLHPVEEETRAAEEEGLNLHLDDGGEEIALEPAHRRLQLVTSDRRFAEIMSGIIEDALARVVRIPLREAGTRLPGEPTPTIVVLDMRANENTVDDLLAVRRSRPSSSVITLVDSEDLTRRAFEAGAVAAIPADPEALAFCFRSLVRTLQSASAGSTQTSVRAGFARLRRVLADIRSGLMSATMALNLMHIISESTERAVLFLVRKDHLSALGAFGFGARGEALAVETKSLRLPLDGDNVFTRCIGDGQPRSLGFDQASLPDSFAALIGRPRSGQVVVFPVLGAERVISVVYTDNGSSNRAIEDIELLELATAQVGVAFENELLRRQIERRSPKRS